MAGTVQRESPDCNMGLTECTTNTSAPTSSASIRELRFFIYGPGSLTLPRYTGFMRLALLVLLTAASLPAEFLEVRLDVRNMDCVTCVQTLELGLKKIRGVEKVTVGPQNSVEFVLIPGNKLTLERFRDAIKGVGFTPGAAHVIVRGKPVTAEGQWRFEVDGIAKIYNLSAAHENTIKSLRATDGKLITVKAVSAPPPDPRTMPSLDVDSVVDPR